MEHPICGGEKESEAILKNALKKYLLSGLVIAGFVLCTSCQVEERTYSPKKVASKPTATLPQQEPDYDYQVRIHPDDSLYIGDVISFEVLAPEGEEIEGQEVEIGVVGDVPLSFGPIAFSDFGIG